MTDLFSDIFPESSVATTETHTAPTASVPPPRQAAPLSEDGPILPLDQEERAALVTELAWLDREVSDGVEITRDTANSLRE
ncbi:MAG TPA: hypothetical protein VME63_02470 [Dyella sp.]|uniref:hypothetical protein n=1 Tax=Dyella sp. TaxID=1869338 RepID=UPI002CE8326E|nr:hypothetical protein [Dyella sp.]HTV84239.1 hypothetical protein [Dyella sp.]